MNRILSRFGINIQVGVIGATALLGFVLIGMLYLASSHQQSAAQAELASAVQSRSLTNQIVIDLLQFRRHEKDFLLRHDEKFVAEHAKELRRSASPRNKGCATQCDTRCTRSNVT
jgi:methyl-accepting chemotaxis protein